MLSKKLRITTLTVLIVLSFSTVVPAIAYGAGEATPASEKDWIYPNSGSWGGNFSPQTKINKDNVNQLELKWIYPAAGKALAPAAIQSAILSEGVNVPPLIKNGKVVVATNYDKIYAYDAKTGELIWTYDNTYDYTAAAKRLPVAIRSSHLHAIRYWERENVVLMNGFMCDFIGVDLNTGKEKFRIVDTCKDVPGNKELFRSNSIGVNVVGTYEKGNLFIFGNPGAVPGPSGGRSNLMGIDMTTYKIVWRVFNFPPHEVSTPDWALQECDIGFFASREGAVACQEVANINKEGLMYDWQYNPALANGPWDIYKNAKPWSPSPYFNVGTSGMWGQPMVDEETGIVYVGVAQASPDGNGTLRPGPNLYATSSMAIDMNKGQRIWWFQHNPHDLRDYDNNWGGMLQNIKLKDGSTVKVYIKGAKDGYLYALDAKTGKPVWRADVFKDTAKFGLKRINGDLFDPKSFAEMTKPWLSYPRNPTKAEPEIVQPGWLNGAFATDMSFHDNTIFHWAQGAPRSITGYREANSKEAGGAWFSDDIKLTNATLIARDAATGEAKWIYFFPYSTVRGHILITGGMVIAGFPDGKLRFLDEKTGTLLREMIVGGPLVTGFTAGADTEGNSMILGVVGQGTIGRLWGAIDPGATIGIGLSGVKASTPSTLTTTQSTTITKTTTEAVTTVTQSVTQTSGLPAEVTYAAVGIAVIALIAAAVLVMRKK